MKTCLVLQLLVATSLAATGLAQADALHGDAGLTGTVVDHAPSLSSNTMPGSGTLLRDLYVADPSRLTGARTGHRLAQLREGIGRVRIMPHVSLGAGSTY